MGTDMIIHDMYCKYCGAELHPNAYTCPNCGCRTDNPETTRPQGKSQIAAGLLALFFGWAGIHNFYLRRYKSAGIQLGLTAGSILLLIISIPLSLFSMNSMTFFMILGMLTPAVCFGVWIWSIVEAILIFCGQIKDGEGNPLL